MQFSERRNITRWFIILASFFIVILILWNTYNFFQIFKTEERAKMEIWVNAQKTLANANEDTDIDLPFQIISNTATIPMIVTTSNDQIISHNNIEESATKDSITLKKYFYSQPSFITFIKLQKCLLKINFGQEWQKKRRIKLEHLYLL